MVAVPVNSTYTAPSTIEESIPTTVNLASMERTGDTILKALRTEYQEQQSCVREIKDNISTLLQGVETEKNGLR